MRNMEVLQKPTPSLGHRCSYPNEKVNKLLLCLLSVSPLRGPNIWSKQGGAGLLFHCRSSGGEEGFGVVFHSLKEEMEQEAECLRPAGRKHK